MATEDLWAGLDRTADDGLARLEHLKLWGLHPGYDHGIQVCLSFTLSGLEGGGEGAVLALLVPLGDLQSVPILAKVFITETQHVPIRLFRGRRERAQGKSLAGHGARM